jgi:hypothetical protein
MTRPRHIVIKVFATEEEGAEIKRRAASANLSLSAYLRTAGLNLPVRSILDMKAVTELSKVNGSLMRLAALLQDCNIPGQADLIKELRDLQKQSLDIMGKILR